MDISTGSFFGGPYYVTDEYYLEYPNSYPYTYVYFDVPDSSQRNYDQLTVTLYATNLQSEVTVDVQQNGFPEQAEYSYPSITHYMGNGLAQAFTLVFLEEDLMTAGRWYFGVENNIHQTSFYFNVNITSSNFTGLPPDSITSTTGPVSTTTTSSSSASQTSVSSSSTTTSSTTGIHTTGVITSSSSTTTTTSSSASQTSVSGKTTSSSSTSSSQSGNPTGTGTGHTSAGATGQSTGGATGQAAGGVTGQASGAQTGPPPAVGAAVFVIPSMLLMTLSIVTLLL